MPHPRPLSPPTDEPAASPPPPFGAVGPLTTRAERGRFGPGNTAALVAGEHSEAFWAAQDGARREIVDAVLQDAGHTSDDAPQALLLAAQGLAQSALLRDSAYRRLIEAGGPMTANGRTRRAFTVWLSALDRLEKHLRLVGLKRVTRRTNIAQQFAAHYVAQRDEGK